MKSRMVNFVKSLNVERVPMHDSKMFRYSGGYPKVIDTPDFYGIMDSTFEIKEHVVPVQHLSQSWVVPGKSSLGRNMVHTKDTFIAVSEEVEDLLMLPFKHQYSKIKDLEYALSHEKVKLWQFQNASIWQRIKYLFTKELPLCTTN
jgi:hypothetical protein